MSAMHDMQPCPTEDAWECAKCGAKVTGEMVAHLRMKGETKACAASRAIEGLRGWGNGAPACEAVKR